MITCLKVKFKKNFTWLKIRKEEIENLNAYLTAKERWTWEGGDEMNFTNKHEG